MYSSQIVLFKPKKRLKFVPGHKFGRLFFRFVVFLLPLIIVAPTATATATATTAFFSPLNELGMIPVLEYHSVGPSEDRWTRSYENFRRDLQWLYNNDYRAVSIADYVGQKIDIPAGKKPVILTFDDGRESQFAFVATSAASVDVKASDDNLDEMSASAIDPQSAIGILDEFLNTHPDFGSAAVFYVNQTFFRALPAISDDLSKAAKYLLGTGREIQNHTAHHADLSKLGPAEVEKELSWFSIFMNGLGVPVEELSIAYPFGGVPKKDALDILKKYAKIGFLVGADPGRMPYDNKFDAYHIPRIQAIDEEWRRWFRRAPGATEKQNQAEIFTSFVSDGDSDTLTILNEKDLKKEALRSGLKIKFFEPLPYEACNDPSAEIFIQYKKNRLSERLKSGLRLRAFSEDISRIFSQWLRHDVIFPSPRGIYFTSSTAAGRQGKVLAEKLRKSGGNMVIFDVKETPGFLSYLSARDGKDRKAQIPDLPAYISSLKQQGIYVVARIVAFKDQLMTGLNPSWAVQNAGGGVWRDDRGVPWLDPSDPDAQDYIIGLAREVAAAGVDEIQYDYVRFPTEGNLATMRFDHVKSEKWPVIRDFLKKSREALIPYGVALSADVFGIVGWNKGYDAKSTGQKIECIAPYLDAIYPMGYPSHFGPGFAGYTNPADKPYDFVYKTTKFFVDFARGTETAIRPWLQAFMYRVTIPYNAEYIRQQIKAAEDAGGKGFALWNAGNNYEVAWGAF